MPESILKDIKSTLALPDDYDAFDKEVILFVNSAISDLHQIGIGPDAGFRVVSDEETWEQFIGNDPRLDSVKTYLFLKAKLLFDPSDKSHVVEMMKEQIREHEWRLNVRREETKWTNPNEQ